MENSDKFTGLSEQVDLPTVDLPGQGLSRRDQKAGRNILWTAANQGFVKSFFEKKFLN